MGRFFVVVPAAGFLNDFFSFFQQFDLTFSLTLDRMGDRFERVQVLHLGTRSHTVASHRSYGEIDVGTHGAFLQFTVGNTKILTDHTQFFQIGDNFFCGTHIRLGYDLDQRDTASIIINQRAVFPFIMDQLSGILFHMHLVYPNGFFAVFCCDLQMSIVTDRQI